MKKKIFISLGLAALIIFISFEIAHASTTPVSSGKIFGGKIVQTKSIEIQKLESTGYTCHVMGSTITIKPVGPYPTSYMIPSFFKSKTNTTLRTGQWIIGKYTGDKDTITCTKQCGETLCVSTVTLDIVSLFGTSK